MSNMVQLHEGILFLIKFALAKPCQNGSRSATLPPYRDGVFAPLSPFHNNVQCVRELPQVRGHTGLVTNALLLNPTPEDSHEHVQHA